MPELGTSELLLLRQVIQQVEDSVLITDNRWDVTDGPRILYANPAFLEMTGYSHEEVIGRSPKMLQGPRTDRRVLDALKAEVKAGHDFSAETLNYRKNGEEYYVRWSITPVRDEEGAINYYASIQRDVTAEVERRRQEMRTQRLESLGNLVGGIAHDLNNILSPILIGAGLLECADSPGMRKSISASMVESAERASDVVKKLLAFARGGSGEKKYLSLEGVVNEIHKIAKETFPRELSVQLKVKDDLWTAYCNDTEIQQVLLNLAINAKDSMEERLEKRETGELIFSAENIRLTEREAMALGAGKEGPYVCLRVEDNGVGMPPEVLDRIFDPFFTTKAEGRGTGLGLPSSLGIVHEHKGFFDVRSEPGAGTRFSVYLPALPDREPEQPSRDYGFSKGGGQKILVVDDEPMITHLVCDMLQQYGYEPRGVTSSVEAWKCFSTQPGEFDAMITDMMMPEMDGLALMEKVLALRPDLPVMVMTGYVHDDKLEKIKQHGVRTLLSKPIRLETLMQEVHQLVN